MHGIITVLVSALLLVLNLTVAQGFPWSAFAIAGMAIGFCTHWWFGDHNLETHLTTQQQKAEARAGRQIGPSLPCPEPPSSASGRRPARLEKLVDALGIKSLSRRRSAR